MFFSLEADTPVRKKYIQTIIAELSRAKRAAEHHG